MKYTSEVIVQVPLKEFIGKMDSLENMKHWQQGLIEYEHVEGNPGAVGAKTKLSYDFKNRKMDLVETIIHKNLPHEFHVNYDAKGMHNKQQNFFTETLEGHTKWTSHSEFIPGNFMMKLMTTFMKGAFKKQSMKYMIDFKNFAEKGISVNNQ